MIKNILFDMGKVLIYFDPEFFISHIKITSKEDIKILDREVFRSVEWVKMDRGDLHEEEAWQQICRRIPEHLHEAAYKLVTMWDRPILPVEGMEELVRELKENGYRIFLLSNASVRQHDYWPRIPGSQYFEDTLISADVRVMKPEPRIYELACQKFGICVSESLFIDDAPVNIEGASRIGMPGIIFHDDVPELRRKLKEYQVNISVF